MTWLSQSIEVNEPTCSAITFCFVSKILPARRQICNSDHTLRPVFVQRLFVRGIFVQSISSNPIRLGQIRLDQVSLGQVSVGQYRLVQVRLSQVRRMLRQTNVPFDQCSVRPMFHSTNVPFDQCFFDESAFDESVFDESVVSHWLASESISQMVIFLILPEGFNEITRQSNDTNTITCC